MKYDFWLELPMMLMSLINNNMFQKDHNFAKLLESACKQLNQSYKYITESFKEYTSNSSPGIHEVPLLREVQEKLHSIQNEKSQLICSAIKFSMKIMGNLVENLEKNHEGVQYLDSLKILKVFLKITRVCSEKAAEGILESNNNEKKLFEVIKIYSEKSQVKLYQISQTVLSNVGKVKQAQTQSNTNVQVNKNDIPLPSICYENSTSTDSTNSVMSCEEIEYC